jgi:hypothetical protein
MAARDGQVMGLLLLVSSGSYISWKTRLPTSILTGASSYPIGELEYELRPSPRGGVRAKPVPFLM